MHTSRRGEDFIASFGYFSRAQQCDDGWVIGYGHRANMCSAARVCKQDARALLRYDLMQIEDKLNTSLKTRISQNRFDALAALASDIGWDRLEQSGILQQVNAGDWREAANCFEQISGTQVSGTQVSGTTRRKAEKTLFLTGKIMTDSVPALLWLALFCLGIGATGIVGSGAIVLLPGSLLYTATVLCYRS